MINFFKTLFNSKKDLEERIVELEYKLAKAEHEKDQVGYFLANRHYLQSVSPKDADNIFNDMSENEKKEHVAQASVIWANSAFQKEIKHILGSQSLFVSSECQSWEQSLIGRGTINGVGLVEERFKRLHSMHLDNIKNNSGSNEEENNEGDGIPMV